MVKYPKISNKELAKIKVPGSCNGEVNRETL